MSELGFSDWATISMIVVLAAYGLYKLVMEFLYSIIDIVQSFAELARAKKALKQKEAIIFLNQELIYKGLAAFDLEISSKPEEEKLRMLAVAYKWAHAFNDALAEYAGLDEDADDFRIF